MEEKEKNIFAELAKVKGKPKELVMDDSFDDEGELTVDVYQSKDEIIVESTVAGVKEEDLDINITNESVTIKGRRERCDEVNEKDFFYQECFWGSFGRSIVLPEEVDPDSSTAVLKNGILTIKMPKLSKKKAGKKMKVKAKE